MFLVLLCAKEVYVVCAWQELERLGQTLIVGRRTNVEWRQNETMQVPENVAHIARRRGRLFFIHAEDYFFIPRNEFPWHCVPADLVIAIPGYDNFLVATAIMNNVSVIDATASVLAVHMTDKEGNRAGFRSAEKNFNKQLIGTFNYQRGRTSMAQYATTVIRNTTYGTLHIVITQRRRQDKKKL